MKITDTKDKELIFKNLDYLVEYADNSEQQNKIIKSKSAVRSPSNSKD